MREAENLAAGLSFLDTTPKGMFSMEKSLSGDTSHVNSGSMIKMQKIFNKVKVRKWSIYTIKQMAPIKPIRPIQALSLSNYKMNFKSHKEVKRNAAISSAALQDHLLRKFNFNFEPKLTINDPARRKTHEKLPSIKREVDVQIQKLEKQQKHSILPYEDEKLKKLKELKSDEERMVRYNKKLTLAQRLGLVEAPPLPLTANDWLNIEEKSKARNDSQSCCSICLEDFKVEPQVILSCSHVFHMTCLNSYEKHNKAKCCPICRRRDYEKKIIDEAIRAFTLKSILRIQRVLRGSKSRIQVYKRLVDQNYKATSVRFNRRLIGFKMWRLSHKIETRIKQNEIFMEKLMTQMEKQHEKSQQDILAEMVEIQRTKLLNQNKIQAYLDQLGIKTQKKEKTEVDWEAVKEKGVNRKDDQCAICLMHLWNKPVYLLSCTHIFHANCVEGFQRYALPGNEKKCPCCRSGYEKCLLQTKQTAPIK